ncbi:MAG TPA: hypothetical protein PLU10_06710 [Chitinophagaceae bacterium]|nr:hypothetical protein [Chitinophagaceae bacterium]
MKAYWFAVASAALLFTSCISIHFSTPSSQAYNKLTESQKASIQFDAPNFCEAKNEDKLYAVNAAQVKQCLKNYEKSIMYFWAPHCHGDHCVPLSFFVNACREKGYHPIIVVEYLAYPEVIEMNNSDVPIFMMDHRYYQVSKTQQCRKPFFDELTHLTKKQQHSGARYYTFQGDQFQSQVVDIKTLGK